MDPNRLWLKIGLQRAARLPILTMSVPSWWTRGKHGQLSPWAKAQVFGMHSIAKAKKWKVTNGEISAAVWKTGYVNKKDGHPSDASISKLRDTFDEDPQWYPGKTEESAAKPGPKPKFTEHKKLAVSRAAMSLKMQGVEPTAAAVVARCPRAATNPDTGKAFDEKLILDVFKTKCYDLDPSNSWGRIQPLSKTAMPSWLEKQRCVWAAKLLKEEERPPSWYDRHCIWMDPCSTIIPSSPRAIFDHSHANSGRGPRWMSKDARIYSRNLRPAPYAGKQAHWGDLRVWWFMVFARGKVRLVIMKDDWTQTAAGMATMVGQLPKLLENMFGDAPKPRVMFTDRGPGFYQGSHGTVCRAYKKALDDHGFRPFAGDNASWQPADIADLLLHESVAAGIRKYFRGNPIKWIDNQAKNYEVFTARLKACEKHINQHHNLSSLSLSFPKRVKKLLKEKGRRLRH
jgi:hypothetical protein